MGGPGTDCEEQRYVFHCKDMDQIVVGVPNMEKAIQVAKEFAEQVETLEFCGYFGKEGRDAKIATVLGNKYRVGAVKFVDD